MLVRARSCLDSVFLCLSCCFWNRACFESSSKLPASTPPRYFCKRLSACNNQRHLRKTAGILRPASVSKKRCLQCLQGPAPLLQLMAPTEPILQLQKVHKYIPRNGSVLFRPVLCGTLAESSSQPPCASPEPSQNLPRRTVAEPYLRAAPDPILAETPSLSARENNYCGFPLVAPQNDKYTQQTYFGASSHNPPPPRLSQLWFASCAGPAAARWSKRCAAPRAPWPWSTTRRSPRSGKHMVVGLNGHGPWVRTQIG